MLAVFAAHGRLNPAVGDGVYDGNLLRHLDNVRVLPREAAPPPDAAAVAPGLC